MLSKIFTTIMSLVLVATSLVTMSSVSNAQQTTSCILKGTPLEGLCTLFGAGGSSSILCPGEIIERLVTNGTTLGLILVLIIAVAYVIKAAIAFVRAEGDEKKVGAAKAAMASILKGIAAMFIAILGIVTINLAFTSSGNNSSSLRRLINDMIGEVRPECKNK